jgi:uncharacterized protein
MERAGRRGHVLISLLLLLLGGYAAIASAAWVFQERLLFPSWLVGAASPLAPGTERLTIRAPDGAELHGVYIPPSPPANGTLILGFAGNASNAADVAAMLHAIYPERAVVTFHYRGYAPSGGMTGADLMLDDAPLIHDLAVARFHPRLIVAVGVSLGSGVAAGLAAARPLAGVVLVTPFDSLKHAARQLYPWLPVGLLLRHDMDSAENLARARVPVAIVAAGADRVILPPRTEALRRRLRTIVFDRTIAGAWHNDIFVHPEFTPAMREAMVAVEHAATTSRDRL